MTFLLILLSSLYEAEESSWARQMPDTSRKRRAYVESEICSYCADMTVLLAYYKALDDKNDDGSMRGKAGTSILKKPFQRVEARYPEKVRRIRGLLEKINAYEATDGQDIDIPVNLSGQMLGEIFRYREDAWADDLQALGEGMGRFIYLMDAYDDLADDIKKNRYNPLKHYQDQEDFETFCEDSLLMMIAECTQIFETLPLEKHLSVLRNVLYSGVWMRYWQKTGQCKHEKQGDEE